MQGETQSLSPPARLRLREGLCSDTGVSVWGRLWAGPLVASEGMELAG